MNPHNNKILAEISALCWHRTIYHDLVLFIPGIQGWFNAQKSIDIIYPINRPKKTSHIILLIDTEKALGKVQYPYIIKTFRKLRIRETSSN